MDFDDFEKKIGVKFRDKKLLKRAFTHRSYINENRKSGLEHNERLEFLGDAVLELVVTEKLYNDYPKEDEGTLTAYRAALVNTDSISEVATKLGANDLLLLSKGEAKDTGRAREYILANTFESIVGAIYLDQGYEPAHKFILENLYGQIKKIIKEKLWIDAKSLFQEKAQEHEGVTPTYETVKEAGPDHNKIFTVGVFLDGKKVTEGSGNSKQEAEQSAAREGLKVNKWM